MQNNAAEYVHELHAEDVPSGRPLVWDSRHYTPQTAFSILRDEVCRQEGMMWLPTYSKDKTFRVRNEARVLDSGVVYRCRHSNFDLERGGREISRSSTDGFCVTRCISGSMAVVQDGIERVMTPGDVAVFDLRHPLKVTGDARDSMGFYVPRGSRPTFEKYSDHFRSILIASNSVSVPLRSCLNVLADQSRSAPELNATLEAAIDLLPIDAGCFEPRDGEATAGDIYREIIRHLEERLANPSLTARSVAVAFGISERHVHRLFARRGTRLGATLQQMRLEGAAGELARRRDRRITDVAFRWGFSDLSTFTRAFKRRFGQSPRRFQSLS